MLSKHVRKKLGSKVISDFTQPKFQTKIQCLFIFCTSNFLVLIILQPETVKLNVTKSYISVDVVGGLCTGAASIFMRRGRKSDIMGFSY